MQINPPYSAVINSPIGKLGLHTVNDQLINLDFLNSADIKLFSPVDPLAKEVIKQLEDYFKNPTFKFNLPILLQGTTFQQNVWWALQQITPGKPLSYGALAKQLNTSARAVGNACRCNPIPIVVPCHRIVGATSIGGFNGARAGAPLNIKSWLLQHESRQTHAIIS